jgi:putative ABC transport system permease protein
MKNLTSALKQVFRLRWMNLIKIVSLALGFAISVALMCRVAWFNSFDNFWQDVENLQILEQRYAWVHSGEQDKSDRCFSALAPEIASKIASVTSATRFSTPWARNFLVNENQFSLILCNVDSSFFDVLKMKMITEGNPKEILEKRSNAIISEKTAKTLFPDGNILGKEIRRGKDIYTVSGVFQDIPEKSLLPTIQIIIGKDLPFIFDDNDSYFTFIRTYPKTNLQELNCEVNELLAPRYENFVDALGVQISFRVSNIHEYSQRNEFDTKGAAMVFILLLITGLNFALLSISSLITRAKEVGVRKASGARASGIFSLIIWETVIYVTMAALLAGALLWGLKPQLDEMFGKFDNIFAFENLWGVGVVLIGLIIFAGIIPAWIFSRIPVTQIFQRFTSNRSHWKRILLFIQFTASILVICIMLISMRQYQIVIAHHYGYDQEKLIWMQMEQTTEAQLQTLLLEIESDSRVEAVSLNTQAVWNGFTGNFATRTLEDAEPIYTKCLGADSTFFKVHGIKMLQGTPHLTGYWETAGNVVVNQAFLNALKIEGNPLGELFYDGQYEKVPFTIVGVCDNFEPLGDGLLPLVIMARDTNWFTIVTIRVNEVTAGVVAMIQEKLKLCYPNKVVPEVKICSDTIYWYFHRLRLDGDIAVFASICLLLITIMGVLGFVNLEIRRRTKEIAIRRIHGSTALGIIWMVSRELLFIALAATPVAIFLAYFFGKRWLRDFSVKAELSWYLFAGATLIIVLTIALCTIIQTWRTANANPARAVKTE